MANATFFSAKTFEFLRQLATNNNREWFAAHKSEYEKHVRDPFLALIEALQPCFAGISPHYRADPKANGGSLFRIYRDARFSTDKSPYKPWAGARFFHERCKQLSAPVFYLHIAPDDCFLGGGMWHPEPANLRKIREFILGNPNSWTEASQNPRFLERFKMGGESAKRAPQGFDAKHPLIEDLKRKDFVCGTPLTEATVCSKDLLPELIDGYSRCAPLLDYLCAALDLEF